MAGERLEATDVSWHGLAGDRRWAFVREAVARSAFPWLTIRQRADMGRYRPAFSDPGRPDASPTAVRTPGGDELDVADPALAAELGHGARAVRQDRGSFDALPLSLLTTRSVSGLGALVGAGLDVRRFRPNLLVEAAGDAPFPEDGWVGRELTLGGLRMRVEARDARCAVVTVDPDTGTRDPAVLRAIAQERDACLGVYGITLRPGRVAVGDAVVLEPA